MIYSFNTATVQIYYTTDKADYDRIRYNTQAIASATFLFNNDKVFEHAPIFSTIKINKIKSNTSSCGIQKDCVIRSGTVQSNAIIKEKIIALINWSPYRIQNYSCTHGLSDITKIRSVDVVIRNDASNRMYSIWKSLGIASNQGESSAQVVEINSTSIVLKDRGSTLGFSNNSFTATNGYVRGWASVRFQI